MFGGGGSTPGGSSAGLLLPPGQAQAAGQLQPIVQPMADQSVNALSALNGISPAQSAYPFVQGTTSNILNNPYQGQAVQGGLDASSIFYNQFLPQSFGATGQLSNFGNLALGEAGGPTGAMYNPAYDVAGAAGSSLSAQLEESEARVRNDAFNPQYQQAIINGNQLAAGEGGAQGVALHDLFNNPQYQLATYTGNQLAAGEGYGQGVALHDLFNPYYPAAEGAGWNISGQLQGAGSGILNAAFDPQQALYNRTQSQISDQVGAQLANSGLSGTPYGASVAGNTLSNFNIDWQNNQLNRMTQGGQAASGLDSAALAALINPAQAATSAIATDLGAAGNATSSALSALLTPSQAGTNAMATDIGAANSAANTSLAALLNPAMAASSAAQGDINTATGAASGALSSLLTPANARSAAQLQGTAALGNLSGIANQGFGSGLNFLNNAAQGASTFGAAPYNAANSVQGNNFGALQNEISLGNQNYVVPQQTVGNLMQYLGLGQSASGLANSIGSTNFNQGMQSAQGLGSLFGTGANLLGGGGGGISSLFGGGLGGGLAQGASGAASLDALAADPAIFASDVGASFGGGGGGILSSILPFAAS